MRNRKKALTRKGKIMVALAVVITFVFVLAWHQMRNVQAYGTYDTGGNKHFVDGHLTVTVNGPDGKSDSLTMYVHSDDYEKNKNVSGATFKKSQHPYTISHYSGGYGSYSLQIKGNENRATIWSEKNSRNNYTLLTIPIKYYLPAHEQHRSWDHVTVNKPISVNPDEDITFYCGGNDGFWDSSEHSSQGDWRYINIHISTALVGTSSTNNKTDANPDGGWRTYDWCSINLNLEKAGRSIYFNGNGGTGADVTWYYTDGDNFSFPTVSRRGYTLDGWLDQETG